MCEKKIAKTPCAHTVTQKALRSTKDYDGAALIENRLLLNGFLSAIRLFFSPFHYFALTRS